MPPTRSRLRLADAGDLPRRGQASPTRPMRFPGRVGRVPPRLKAVAPVRARSVVPPRAASHGDARATARAFYVRLLTWAFTFFNSVRVLSYLPTLWTLAHSSDSSQHSLWTWGTWFFANLTMSLWLLERNGSRLDRAAVVNLGNAAMCLAVIVLIVVTRF